MESLPLEQRMVRKGHWLIEGYDVKRQPAVSGWHVYNGTAWLTWVNKLDDARDWIRGQIHNG